VLEAQDRNALKLQSSIDGALQLFIDTLQLLVDEPADFPNLLQKRIFLPHGSESSTWVQDGRHGEQIAPATCGSLRALARSLLQRFCASRAYLPGLQGFISLPDMERWLRSFDSLHSVRCLRTE
jgi:hypothetical protein